LNLLEINLVTAYQTYTYTCIIRDNLEQYPFTHVTFIFFAKVVQISSKYSVSPKDLFVVRVVLWDPCLSACWNIYQYCP